ncbi:transglutaminase family protein [Variovorax defluvii]|uniref:Transglutaminase family protein n=2 Tax=Variovorax defluvii TaxID=913761 RepID=A0ABP8GW47_9BURK
MTRPGRHIDSDHPSIVAFARSTTAGIGDDKDKAISLYLAVRDRLRYDPYNIDHTEGGFRASRCLASGRGFCITKAAVLAAAARAVFIPARVGYADVRNHLTSPRLEAMMKTDLFVFHGYAEMFLGGRWVKATPAFNLTLCAKAGIEPLEFDGVNDSIFHPFDASGRQHMEYVRDRGTYEDVPRDEILAAWRAVYPPETGWGIPLEGDAVELSHDFEKDVAARAPVRTP